MAPEAHLPSEQHRVQPEEVRYTPIFSFLNSILVKLSAESFKWNQMINTGSILKRSACCCRCAVCYLARMTIQICRCLFRIVKATQVYPLCTVCEHIFCQICFFLHNLFFFFRVSDKQTLEQILTPYIHPTESDPVTRQKWALTLNFHVIICYHCFCRPTNIFFPETIPRLIFRVLAEYQSNISALFPRKCQVYKPLCVALIELCKLICACNYRSVLNFKWRP